MNIPIWRQIQRKNFTRIGPLLEFLELAPASQEKVLEKPRFPLNLPLRLAEKIEKNCLDDPIFRQFVPLEEELVKQEGFLLDPVADKSFCKTKKLLHKYEGRVLILASGACAMHCRFCFRQNFPYEKEIEGFSEELTYLADNRNVSEVILSGGDPLSLSDASLGALLEALDSIAHIKRIRFHTRFPIGIPERIDDSFLKILGSVQKQIYFSIHCNHPKELDVDVIAALRKVGRLGIPLLSQSVLLRGVNDDPEVLKTLFETLADAAILPYYLHELDLVEGGAHFLSPKGPQLMRELQTKLSGYALPRLVTEQPGKSSKTWIAF